MTTIERDPGEGADRRPRASRPRPRRAIDAVRRRARPARHQRVGLLGNGDDLSLFWEHRDGEVLVNPDFQARMAVYAALAKLAPHVMAELETLRPDAEAAFINPPPHDESIDERVNSLARDQAIVLSHIVDWAHQHNLPPGWILCDALGFLFSGVGQVADG